VTGFYEHGNEPTVSIKDKTFLDSQSSLPASYKVDCTMQLV
jgi:hypothetical protein